MNILHIISSLKQEGGGPAQGLRNLTSFYSDFGVKATVISMDESTDDLGNIEHLDVIRIGRGKGSFYYHPNLIKTIKQRAHNFDAVIVHGLWQYHTYAVYKALKNLSIHYYVFPHGMLDPYFNKTYPFKFIKKYIFWFVAQYSILKAARAVLFTCEEEMLVARKSFKPYKICEKVVNYGTTITEIANNSSSDDFLNRYPQLKGKRLFLFLSRIHEKKGCDLLIKAFASIVTQHENIHLVMAGPDQTGLKQQLKDLANSLNIDKHITWTGMLKDKEKWGAIKASEVFILPSHQENFGIAVAESLALGTPVLISNKVNIWREIDKSNAGLIEDDTLNGTVRLLKKWIELSEDQKELMRINSIKCFESKFNIKKASQNIINLLKSVHHE